MCILLSLSWLLFIFSLEIKSTNGTLPHIRIETKLSTLEDITIGVLALVLCIVLSFAAYFLYLRIITRNRRIISTRSGYHNINNRSNRDYSQNRLVSINDDQSMIMSSDTTSLLLKRTKSITNGCYNFDDDNLGLNDDKNGNQISSYVSFGAYGAVEDKESTSP